MADVFTEYGTMSFQILMLHVAYIGDKNALSKLFVDFTKYIISNFILYNGLIELNKEHC